LIDVAPEEDKAGVQLLLHYNIRDKDDNKTYLDVPELATGASWSVLPADLRGQAETGFAAGHDNWLSMRTVSARYSWSIRHMERGRWEDSPQEAPRTGTMAYQIVPRTQEEALALGHPLRMQLLWRVHDNELQWNAAADDTVSGSGRMVYWQEGHAPEASNTAPPQGMLPWHLFNQVPSIMAGAYADEQWGGVRCTREEFFKDITPAIRISSDEETETLLSGERCYMFLDWLAQPRIWISATTGEVRQFDMWEPGYAVMGTRRYENYVTDPTANLSFPSRVVYTKTEGKGADQKGYMETVELSDIQINPDLPPETFQVR